MNKRILSKLTCLALAVALALSAVGALVGCNGVKKLDTPTNPAVSGEGVITWDAVQNAEEYLIVTSTGMYISYENMFTLPDATKSCTITITAKASDFDDSDASEEITFTPASLLPEEPAIDPDVSIYADSFSVKSEGELTLHARVVGLDSEEVTWSLRSGGEFVTLAGNKLTAKKIENKNQRAVVRATSNEDPSVYDEREIYVVARQKLTQEMLDELKLDKVDYSGMLDIDYYTTDLVPVYDGSVQISLTTGMNKDEWYAAYQNSINGALSYIHFKNRDGYCNQVGISLMNKEEYFPVYDESRRLETWENAGLYNSFNAGIVSLSDFVFNTETWRYDYKVTYDEDGMPVDPKQFMNRSISSANPHTFTPKNMSLIIDEGHIIGFYSESTDDPGVMNQRIARMRMTVGINIGENAVVREIDKFPTVENEEFSHAALQAAIDKTAAATSFKLDFRKQERMLAAGGLTTFTGYEEYVTDDVCYFKPYEFTVKNSGEIDEVRYTRNGEYGYKKITDGLYNSFNRESSDKYVAARAFEGDFDNAKPSFAFAAEIFTSYAEDADGKYTTYFVDPSMMTVATTFYNGVGSDAQLYGLYASMPWYGYEITATNFPPMVIVDNDTGYIVEMMFYYNLYYMNGYIDIRLEFDNVTLPDEMNGVTFETRQVPDKWSDVKIIESGEDDEEDVEIAGDEFLRTFFDDPDAATTIPFFGNALGDNFGFGMKRTRNFSWDLRPIETVCLYYDVSVDLDYSIDSSIQKIERYIVENGYALSAHGIYKKDGYCVYIEDSDLDLFVYVWKEDATV